MLALWLDAGGDRPAPPAQPGARRATRRPASEVTGRCPTGAPHVLQHRCDAPMLYAETCERGGVRAAREWERARSKARRMTVIAASRSADDEEVQGILIDLAATAHRHGMYPSGHPQLRIVAQRLADRLRAWLARNGSLALGVGHDTLFLRGSPDACCPPIVRDFAHRLRDHQIGAVSFFEDVAWSELERLFAALSADPARCPAIDAVPFGPNLEVRPAGYDRVSLGEADPEAPAGPDPETLWAELARAALDDDSDATAASFGARH